MSDVLGVPSVFIFEGTSYNMFSGPTMEMRVNKVLGTESPADFMTKILGIKDIDLRLGYMNMKANWPRCKLGED